MSATEVTPLELASVSSGYGRTIVLRDISMVVPPSSVVALLGPNGAGKSTLLKTIAGLIRPTAGDMRLFGKAVTKSKPHKLARNGLCLIPEGRGVFRSLTVRENLALQAGSTRNTKALEMITDAFPVLGQRFDQTAGSLSGGEQQMLALARAYIKNPRLVLVDEASLGLAPLLVESIFSFLRRLASEGASLLIVDQFVTQALAMADHAYVLTRGYITFSGAPEQLRNSDIFERYLGGGWS
jgi:branched-chain amino acid transport system ATP-binding protein